MQSETVLIIITTHLYKALATGSYMLIASTGHMRRRVGIRFDATKILLDPYANAVAVPENYQRYADIHCRQQNTPCMKSVVADLSLYDWEEDKHMKTTFCKNRDL